MTDAELDTRGVQILSPVTSAGTLLAMFKDPVTGIYSVPRNLDDENVARHVVQQFLDEAQFCRGLSDAQVEAFLKSVLEKTKSAKAVEMAREGFAFWRALTKDEYEKKLKAIQETGLSKEAYVAPESMRWAIVDSGLMLDHPVLAGWVDAANSIDFTGEGLEDRNGHGTMCALTARQGGKLNVKLLNVKVIREDGSGTVKDLVKALEWLTDYQQQNRAIKLQVNLSVGFYKKKWGFLKCDGHCTLCTAAWALAEAGASLTMAPGNTAGETACPATAAVVRGHPNMVAYAAGLYPDSGVGTHVTPTTTMFEADPVPGAGTQEAVDALLARLRADPAREELHLALLRIRDLLPMPAETFYAELAAAHPDIAAVHFFWGNTLVLNGKPVEAEPRLREAIRLNPKDTIAHQTLAVALAGQKKFQDAVKETLQSIQLDPDSARSYYNLGTLYSELKRPADAEKAYRNAIRLDREEAEAHYNLGVLLGEGGRDQEAIKEYREAIRCKPNHASARFNLGRLLFRNQDVEGAEKEFRAAIAINPGHAAGHCDLGVLCERKGNPREADAEYRKAIQADPNFPEAHHNLAGLYYDRGLYREAVAEYREAVRCRPNYASALKNLEQSLALEKQNQGRQDK